VGIIEQYPANSKCKISKNMSNSQNLLDRDAVIGGDIVSTLRFAPVVIVVSLVVSPGRESGL